MSLERTIEEHARAFTARLLEALSQATFEEISAYAVVPATKKRTAATATRSTTTARLLPDPELEESIIEHLYRAGAKGSTAIAWVAETHRPRSPGERNEIETNARHALDTLARRGNIVARPAKTGTVYALAPELLAAMQSTAITDIVFDEPVAPRRRARS